MGAAAISHHLQFPLSRLLVHTQVQSGEVGEAESPGGAVVEDFAQPGQDAEHHERFAHHLQLCFSQEEFDWPVDSPEYTWVRKLIGLRRKGCRSSGTRAPFSAVKLTSPHGPEHARCLGSSCTMIPPTDTV